MEDALMPYPLIIDLAQKVLLAASIEPQSIHIKYFISTSIDFIELFQYS